MTSGLLVSCYTVVFFFWVQSKKVWWQDATLFVYFSYFMTYIHSFNHIHTIHIYPSPVAKVFLHLFIAGKLSGKTSLWCRAENRTQACLTASRRATNWATRHHNLATPHHTEPHRTILSHAAPYLSTITFNGLNGEIKNPKNLAL